MTTNLRHMVKEGRVDKALNSLYAIALEQRWDEKDINEIILLNARFCRAEGEKRRGTSESTVEFIKIDEATLSLISKYKDQIDQTETTIIYKSSLPREEVSEDLPTQSLSQWLMKVGRLLFLLL